MTANSSLTTIRLIARREIVTRIKTKSFLLSTFGIMAVIIIGLILLSAFTGGGDDPKRVGVVGGGDGLGQAIEAVGAASGQSVTVSSVADAAQAKAKVDAESLDAALVPGTAGHYTIYSKSALDPTLDGILRSAVTQQRLGTYLSEQGTSLAELQPRIDVVETHPADPDVTQRIVVAFAGSIMLVTAIMMGGTMVSVGVVEEKTSRVVELLLAAVRPLELLWGKILGIGTISLGQVLLFGATGLIAGSATGLLTITGTAVTMLAAVIVWFLLGYLFFASLYAAAGAMVSRQEELASTTTPLTLLMLAVLYAGMFGIQALDSTFIQTLSWIPPFSASLMPARIATGDTDAVQIWATLGLQALACAAAVWAASRIYQRSVLHTGSRIGWLQLAGTLRGR